MSGTEKLEWIHNIGQKNMQTLFPRAKIQSFTHIKEQALPFSSAFCEIDQ